MSIMRCEKHDRSWDSDMLEECPLCEETVVALLIQAIDHNNLLSFKFRGSSYTVEPHAYGETASGEEVLRCFQVGSDQPSNFGWLLIPVAEVAIFEVLEQHFPGPRTGYAPGDRGMRRIYAQLPERGQR